MNRSAIFISSSQVAVESPSAAKSPVFIRTLPGKEIETLENLGISIQESSGVKTAIYFDLDNALATLSAGEAKTGTCQLVPWPSLYQVYDSFGNLVTNQPLYNPYYNLMNLLAGAFGAFARTCTDFAFDISGLNSPSSTFSALVLEKLVAEKLLGESKPAWESLYQVNDITSVNEFVAKYDFLEPLLIEARNEIAKVFGKEIPVSLELSTDPEYDDEPQLSASILTPWDVKESRALLKKFDQAWWLDNLDRAQWKFHIEMEFV